VIAQLDFTQATPDVVPTPLTLEEKTRLRQLELTVEKTIQGFIQCGRALLEIRESRLYRERYATFADYCRERFAIARSTADQLCRSTQVFQTLEATLADSEKPPEIVSELALRPISRLPGPLQTETWRLASRIAPEGKTPTHAVTARVSRMIGETIAEAGGNGKEHKHGQALPARLQSFLAPVQRLAKYDTFDPSLAIVHVKDSTQAGKISENCEVLVSRCRQIQSQLRAKFPDAHLYKQASA
jgi:hypothetical protein